MNKKIFRQYDIRGRYPREINEKVVFETAEAIARFFKKGKVIVGHDGRASSDKLYRAAIDGFKNGKLEIIGAGTITTPMLSFLVNRLKAVGGTIITASHNPPVWNGLKVVKKNAVALSGLEILKMINK